MSRNQMRKAYRAVHGRCPGRIVSWQLFYFMVAVHGLDTAINRSGHKTPLWHWM